MGWQETSKVIERMKFVLEYKSGRWTMTELCERFGISRPTGYSTIRKSEAEGPEGLRDHSRKPHSCPHRTKEETASESSSSRKSSLSSAPRRFGAF